MTDLLGLDIVTPSATIYRAPFVSRVLWPRQNLRAEVEDSGRPRVPYSINLWVGLRD